MLNVEPLVTYTLSDRIHVLGAVLRSQILTELILLAQVYLDLSLCPQALRTDRAIGDKSALCSDPRPLGRLVIGLYGDTAPGTVAAFTSLLQSGAYTGTTINKIFPGRYIKAGKQGSKRYGEVDAVLLGMQDPLPPNPDLVRT